MEIEIVADGAMVQNKILWLPQTTNYVKFIAKADVDTFNAVWTRKL